MATYTKTGKATGLRRISGSKTATSSSRTAIPVHTLSRTGTVQPSTTPADVAGMVIEAYDGQSLIQISSTDGSDRTVTIRRNPDLISVSGIAYGDNVITVAAGGTVLVPPLPVAAYRQNDNNDIFVDPAVSTTLQFLVYTVPPAS